MAKITVSTLVHAPVETVWKCWNEPGHVTSWAFADPSWHAPHATNDLRVGGKFTTRMEARDGSMGFDFEGVYSEVEPLARIAYTMADGREVSVDFETVGDDTRVTEVFDAESENPEEMQRAGWQSILENFKRHAESHA